MKSSLALLCCAAIACLLTAVSAKPVPVDNDQDMQEAGWADQPQRSQAPMFHFGSGQTHGHIAAHYTQQQAPMYHFGSGQTPPIAHSAPQPMYHFGSGQTPPTAHSAPQPMFHFGLGAQAHPAHPALQPMYHFGLGAQAPSAGPHVVTSGLPPTRSEQVQVTTGQESSHERFMREMGARSHGNVAPLLDHDHDRSMERVARFNDFKARQEAGISSLPVTADTGSSRKRRRSVDDSVSTSSQKRQDNELPRQK